MTLASDKAMKLFRKALDFTYTIQSNAQRIIFHCNDNVKEDAKQCSHFVKIIKPLVRPQSY